MQITIIFDVDLYIFNINLKNSDIMKTLSKITGIKNIIQNSVVILLFVLVVITLTALIFQVVAEPGTLARASFAILD
jgi:hypothetical protein